MEFNVIESMKLYEVDSNIFLFFSDWWILLDIKSFHSKGITRIHKAMRSIEWERESPLDKIEEISYPLIIFVWWTMFAICYSSLLWFFYIYNFNHIYIFFPNFLKTRSTDLKFPSLKILNLFHLPSTFAFSFKKYVGVSHEIETLALKLVVGCPVGKGTHCLIKKVFGYE